MGNEFTPIAYIYGCVKVPAIYKKTSPNYEGYHDAFWVSPKGVADDMEIRTRSTRG